MKKEPEYAIRVSSPATTFTIEGDFYTARGKERRPLTFLEPQTSEVSNKDIEGLLKGLLVTFENATTRHYCVKKAKTSIVTTKNAEGKLGVSLGMNVFKIFDATGAVKGERTEGIEIEIERKEQSR